MCFRKNQKGEALNARHLSCSFFICVMMLCFGMTGCNEDEPVAFSDGGRLRTVRASELAYFRLSDIHWDSSYVYKVMDGNVQVGQVCREYLRTQDQELVAQAIVAYPMYRNKPDLSNGYIIQVNREDGSASTTVKHGGIVRWSAIRNVIDYYREGDKTNVSDTVVYGGGNFGDAAGSCGCGYRLELEPDILIDKRADEKQAYKLVKIGKQYWMQENLRAEHLNDGTEIPNMKTPNWSANVVAMCYYRNDLENRSVYGGLYKGACITTNKLAPIDYRVPSDEDWGLMEAYLGIPEPLTTNGGRGENQGDLLKRVSSLWNDSVQQGNNLTGFCALPGCARNNLGSGYLGGGAFFWTSTKFYEIYYMDRRVLSNTSQVSRMYYNQSAGMSVRCLKDE